MIDAPWDVPSHDGHPMNEVVISGDSGLVMVKVTGLKDLATEDAPMH